MKNLIFIIFLFLSFGASTQIYLDGELMGKKSEQIYIEIYDTGTHFFVKLNNQDCYKMVTMPDGATLYFWSFGDIYKYLKKNGVIIKWEVNEVETFECKSRKRQKT